MRALLVLVLIVVLMAMGGWLVFNFGNNSASVEIRTDKIERDTSQAVEKTKDLLHRAENGLDKSINSSASSSDDSL